MGIEYIIVNPDKRELLDFDRLGFGTKIGATTLLRCSGANLRPCAAKFWRWE